MSIVIFFLIFLPLSLWFATLASERTARAFVLKVVLWSWLLFMPLLSAMNAWMPFTDGGDDSGYYELADTPFRSIADALDLKRFIAFMDQPGYPWLLSLTNSLTGHDLYVYKGLNFFFLVSLSLVWYRIGLILEGRAFAKRIMLVILLLTPLWNYVFFLLKDMSITLLQSLFLLVAIQLQLRPAIRPFLIAIISTILLLLFRTPLVLQNAAVLLGGLIAKSFGRSGRSVSLMPILIGLLVVTALTPVVTNPNILASLGLTNEQQVIGSLAFNESRIVHFEASTMNRSLFPLIYLFSETAGLSPKQWSSFDRIWLRGVLAIPWIIFISPFFLIGIFRLFKPSTDVPKAYGFFARLRASRIINTPWSMVLLFVSISIAISWTVGDTTRWRIPDMPMVAAVSVAGWSLTPISLRQRLLLGWIAASCTSFLTFYLVGG